jgi:hypothetical protein
MTWHSADPPVVGLALLAPLTDALPGLVFWCDRSRGWRPSLLTDALPGLVPRGRFIVRVEQGEESWLPGASTIEAAVAGTSWQTDILDWTG